MQEDAVGNQTAVLGTNKNLDTPEQSGSSEQVGEEIVNYEKVLHCKRGS